jgi:Glycosyl transferase family 2
MNLPAGLPHLIAYVIPLEADRARRDVSENRGGDSAPPPIQFLEPQDPSIELSIVIPAWNPKAEHFRRCLSSLKSAQLAGIAHEIVVSDDASDSDDAGILARGAGLPGLRYVRQEKNLGGFGNFNWCLSAARGTWIHMLHQDDWIEPGFYTELLRGEAQASGAPLRFCRTRLFFEDVGRMQLMFDEAPRAGVIRDFIRRQSVSQRLQISGTILRRSELGGIGGYDPRLGAGGDWEFWARWIALHPVFYSPNPLATYSLHSGSWSSRDTAGARNARSLEQHRLVLLRIMGHLTSDLWQHAATGFYRTMFERILGYAAQNNQANSPKANRLLIDSFLPGTVERGLAPDLERLLSCVR